MKKSLLRRIRKEIRERDDIAPMQTVVLRETEKRAGNIRAAELILREVFEDRITIEKSKDTGIICGSREEAGALRLAEFTKRQAEQTVFLSSLTKKEIETFLSEHGCDIDVYVPNTAEVRLIEQLAEDFADVRFGV